MIPGVSSVVELHRQYRWRLADAKLQREDGRITAHQYAAKIGRARRLFREGMLKLRKSG